MGVVIEDILQREGMAEQKNTRAELPAGAGNKLDKNVAVSTPNTKPLDCYLKYVGNDVWNESYSRKMKNRGLDGAVCEGECSCDAQIQKTLLKLISREPLNAVYVERFSKPWKKCRSTIHL